MGRKRTVTAAIREARSGPCAKCGLAVPCDAHHIVAVSDGGGDGPENIIALCTRCHLEWGVYEVTEGLIPDVDGATSAAHAERRAVVGLPVASFDQWLTLPPAWFILSAYEHMRLLPEEEEMHGGPVAGIALGIDRIWLGFLHERRAGGESVPEAMSEQAAERETFVLRVGGWGGPNPEWSVG